MALMESVTTAAGGPILLGVLIILTEILKWPRWVHYIWAVVAILWGVIALV